MNLVSAIGVVYLGIYLVLPGCLCQLLETFGVAVHDRSVPRSECVIVDASTSFICLCDHQAPKTAELSPTESDPDNQAQFVTGLSNRRIDFFLSADATRVRQSRAPPGSGTSLSHRSFSGVFLI